MRRAPLMFLLALACQSTPDAVAPPPAASPPPSPATEGRVVEVSASIDTSFLFVGERRAVRWALRCSALRCSVHWPTFATGDTSVAELAGELGAWALRARAPGRVVVTARAESVATAFAADVQPRPPLSSTVTIDSVVVGNGFNFYDQEAAYVPRVFVHVAEGEGPVRVEGVLFTLGVRSWVTDYCRMSRTLSSSHSTPLLVDDDGASFSYYYGNQIAPPGAHEARVLVVERDGRRTLAVSRGSIEVPVARLPPTPNPWPQSLTAFCAN